MLFLLILCGLLSAVVCAILIRAGGRSAERYSMDMPQRFHSGHIPRVGGVAMLVACSVGWAWMVIAEPQFGIPNGIQFAPGEALGWWLVCAVACAGGTAEDLWHNLAPRWRLIFTLGAAICAVLLMDVSVPRLDLASIDRVWTAAPVAGVVLAVVAVAGLPHAFNLIDGYNGLAGTVAAICCAALVYVALQVGDRQLAGTMVVLAGSTAGFLVWNYPRGLIFAGDGGAYLWGAGIALACILLVQRHPQVSPWFPVLLLAYPVLETGFSVYRKVVRGQSPSVADALHFHQLVYRRIVRAVFDSDESRRLLVRNNRTSPYLWSFAVLTVAPATLFWRSTPVLMAFSILFVVSYVYAYTRIVRFKVPHWLRRPE